MDGATTLSPALSLKKAATEVAVLTALAVLFPFLIHLIPTWDDTPLGARLLPIFYAPLVASILLHPGLSLAFAALTPWLNYLLTGHPSPGMAVLLMVELVIFTFWIRILSVNSGFRWWMGPAAYLLTKPFSGILIVVLPNLIHHSNFLLHLSSAVTRSWPGILILALLGALVMRLLNSKD